jgi:hypothetical protein
MTSTASLSYHQDMSYALLCMIRKPIILQMPYGNPVFPAWDLQHVAIIYDCNLPDGCGLCSYHIRKKITFVWFTPRKMLLTSGPTFHNMAAHETIPVPIGEMTGNGADDFGKPNGPTTSIEVNALVVGAGFSGITAIHRLRKVGLAFKCMEASGDFGGLLDFHRYESYLCSVNVDHANNAVDIMALVWTTRCPSISTTYPKYIGTGNFQSAFRDTKSFEVTLLIWIRYST